MNSEPSISIIISCFNEAGNIEACIRSVHAALPQAEIVVVHGGTDETLEIAKSLSETIPRIKPVRNVDDRGKGHGIKTGIAASRGRWIAQFDADLQFEANDLIAMVERVRSGACDVCVGSRFLRASDRSGYTASLFRNVGNRVMSLYISVLCGKYLADITTGMKAFSREAIDRIAFRDDRYSYEAEILVKAVIMGLRIEEIPVKYHNRAGGDSMHRNNLAVTKAGFVIMAKCLGYAAQTWGKVLCHGRRGGSAP